MKNKFSFYWTTLLLALILLTQTAAPITPDPTFGTGGKVVTDFPFTSSSDYTSFGSYVLSDPSGRIVGLGHHIQPAEKGPSVGVALAGLTSSGSLDTGFGGGGKILDWNGIIHTQLHDAQMLPDGRLLRLTIYISFFSAGATLKLIRHQANGSVDSSFNPFFFMNGTPTPIKFSVGNDGKIFVLVRSAFQRYYVFRLNSDGSRDTAFGTDGIKELPALARLPNPVISRIFALPNGKVIVGGTIGPATNNSDEAFFARFDSDGNSDRSFGRLGIMRHWFGKKVTLRGMLLQADKYVLAGSIQDPDIDVLMVRSTARGRLDHSFGEGGVVRDDFTPGGSDFANAAALDANGKIIIAGEADQDIASPSNFLAARYSADGVREDNEQTFFTNGFDAGAAGLSIQPDGKIVLIGYARNPNMSVNGNVFAFARYND